MDINSIKKIDIHVHATAYPELSPKVYEGTSKLSAEQIIKIYDELNVEKKVLPVPFPFFPYLQVCSSSLQEGTL